jgi:hypothetical protein
MSTHNVRTTTQHTHLRWALSSTYLVPSETKASLVLCWYWYNGDVHILFFVISSFWCVHDDASSLEVHEHTLFWGVFFCVITDRWLMRIIIESACGRRIGWTSDGLKMLSLYLNTQQFSCCCFCSCFILFGWLTGIAAVECTHIHISEEEYAAQQYKFSHSSAAKFLILLLAKLLPLSLTIFTVEQAGP